MAERDWVGNARLGFEIGEQDKMAALSFGILTGTYMHQCCVRIANA